MNTHGLIFEKRLLSFAEREFRVLTSLNDDTLFHLVGGGEESQHKVLFTQLVLHVEPT